MSTIREWGRILAGNDTCPAKLFGRLTCVQSEVPDAYSFLPMSRWLMANQFGDRVLQIPHPLAGHHLRMIRDASTRSSHFREAMQRLAMLLGVYATADLPTHDEPVTTPLAETTTPVLSVRVGLVPILRAGLGLVDPLLDLLPDAEVWHLGMYRNEETATPISYYDKIPVSHPVDVGLVLDPMLATGGSIRLVVERLKRWGVRDIRILSVIASEPGIDRLLDEFEDIRIFVGWIDPELNPHAYIVPGLGDAGDRIFNTPGQ